MAGAFYDTGYDAWLYDGGDNYFTCEADECKDCPNLKYCDEAD